MIQLQFDLFKTKEEIEYDALRKTIEDIRISNDKVRKKLFAEHGKDRKLLIELDERLKIIEKFICKPNEIYD